MDFDDDLGGSGYSYDEFYNSADVCNAVDERYGYVGEVSEGLVSKREKAESKEKIQTEACHLFQYALILLTFMVPGRRFHHSKMSLDLLSIKSKGTPALS